MDDPDLSARKHLAAHDPAFPARREEAWGRIVSALDRALSENGYALKGSTWTRISARGKSAVHLQRNRYGWDVQIMLRFVTPEGDRPAHWDDDETTLELWGAGDGDDPGRLTFLDVLEEPAILSRTIEILMTGALPWLDAHHAGVETDD